ncbi:MAG: hypothetical protein ACYC6R_03385 [Anaerolineales bacterium]
MPAIALVIEVNFATVGVAFAHPTFIFTCKPYVENNKPWERSDGTLRFALG